MAVRAEPILLKATVKRDMPCLTAQLIKSGSDSNDEPLLQGQNGTWILRLSNMGTAPASNIVLKTNLPWVKIPSAGAQVEDDSAIFVLWKCHFKAWLMSCLGVWF